MGKSNRFLAPVSVVPLPPSRVYSNDNYWITKCSTRNWRLILNHWPFINIYLFAPFPAAGWMPRAIDILRKFVLASEPLLSTMENLRRQHRKVPGCLMRRSITVDCGCIEGYWRLVRGTMSWKSFRAGRTHLIGTTEAWVLGMTNGL